MDVALVGLFRAYLLILNTLSTESSCAHFSFRTWMDYRNRHGPDQAHGKGEYIGRNRNPLSELRTQITGHRVSTGFVRDGMGGPHANF
jgi:hypothetical protein